MKLGDFIPELAVEHKSLIQANTFMKQVSDSGFTNYLKSAHQKYPHNVSDVSQYGIEQLYFDWLRTAYSYRRMFIQDLYLLAFDVAEIRTPLLHLRGEIFRKGLDEWEPLFAVKCGECGIEYETQVEECERCHSKNLVKPDSEQYKYFDEFKKNCNIYGQSLDEILATCLVPGTEILTRKGKSNFTAVDIENITIGTKVWTHTGKLRKVTELFKREIDEDIIVLHLDNNEVIKLTANHRVFTKVGWKRADELSTDDILLKLQEVHPTWSKRLSMTRLKTAPHNRHKRSKESIQKQLKTRKYRKEILGVNYSFSSPNILKGKTFKEFFGEEKAAKIKYKMLQNKPDFSGKKNPMYGTKRKGVGNYFRSKKGNFKLKNNPNWRGGVSFEPYSIEFNTSLKREVFIRDNSICQECGENRLWKKLDCHHIDYNKKNNTLMNLISLCPTCHSKTNFNREYWKNHFEDVMNNKVVGVHNGTRIFKIDKEHYKGFVYNLEVEEDHSYTGKGIIFHNCEDDINIVDDMYLFLNKQYGFLNNKLYGRVIEIRRIHPAVMEYDLDKNGLPENSHWFCPLHRDKILPKPIACPICGLESVPAMFIWNHRGKRIYLSKDEVIHCSKFNPSETYGYSPLLTIMQKVLTISGMDRFLYRYFFERKAPTGMILTYTDDTQSLEQERARIESKMMEDPTYLPWVAVSSKTQRGRTDFVKLFHTLHEMDYLNVRNEIRDRVSMIYGVPQIYMNVMEGSGGLSGQTQQLKVFSNVIEADQRRYNDKIFPRLLDAFGITDWKIKLQAPEEKVESVILQQAQQKIMIASSMLQMGFDVKLKPGTKNIDELDFVFSGKPISQREQMEAMQQAQGQAQIGPAIEQGLEDSQNLQGHRLETGTYQDPDRQKINEGELV